MKQPQPLKAFAVCAFMFAAATTLVDYTQNKRLDAIEKKTDYRNFTDSFGRRGVVINGMLFDSCGTMATNSATPPNHLEPLKKSEAQSESADSC